MDFAALGAHPTLLRALTARGYESPTPVQAAVLAPERVGRDLLVSAETGSGKTVAFGLAMAPTLLGERETFEAPARPLALVLAPTRELALQVQRELQWLYGPAGMRSTAAVGGMGMQLQLKQLGQGVHLVVGTPGRLCDHLQRGALALDDLRALVLDEADEMLDMGFREELDRIIDAAPKARRTLMFSATLPADIQRLAGQWLKDPVRVTATPPERAHADIEYRAHAVDGREREHAVVNVLRHHDAASAIVFCTTREGVSRLAASLQERGFACVAISGELAQPERTRALQALRDGRARVLVATDVAARGIDLPEVSLVVHADLPHDAQALQHRSGRTGRAGRKGVSVILAPAERRRMAQRLLYEAHVNATWGDVPKADDIRVRDRQRLVESLVTEVELDDEDLAVGRELLGRVAPEVLAARLVAREREKLPEPEDLPLTARVAALPDRPPRPAPGGRYEPRGGRYEPRGQRPYEPRSPRPYEPRGDRPYERPGDGGGPRRPPARGRGPEGESTWFSLNVGRANDADPKWLIPVLCRRGGITKDDIGAIRVGDRETRVEILGDVARDFAERVRRPDPKDPRLSIVAAPPGAPPRGPSRDPERRPGPAVRRGK